MALPKLQEVVALIGRGQAIGMLESAPMRLRGRHGVEDLDPRDLPVRGRQTAGTGRDGAYGHDVHGL